MIVRGFEMEKGVDYVDNFSPTPGLAVARPIYIHTSDDVPCCRKRYGAAQNRYRASFLTS